MIWAVGRVWNGDRRLREKYGDEVFEAFKEQTSVMPFQAILEVRPLFFCLDFIVLMMLTSSWGLGLALRLSVHQRPKLFRKG
jgi:uncharacterized membrane protein